MSSTTTSATAAAGGEVAARLGELRELASTDIDAAATRAWQWIEQLSERAGSDRAGADAELGELFALGRPPGGLDGPTDGILVTPLIQPRLDVAVRALTSRWMPWQGKTFDAAASRGENVLAGSARWPAKLLWPLYGTKPAPDGRLAFEFQTRVEPGMHDPDTEVLVIDYAPVTDNPRLVIRSIRDELVELVPGANLGKILFKGRGSYRNIGYFALRS